MQRELENERARGIHSCHDNCTQDGCVNRRLHEELNTTRKQLAEAQALNAQVLSVAEKMRCAGGAQEFQHWFDELKLFLLRKPDISAIEAAVEAAVPHDLPSEQSFLDSGGYLLLEKQND